MMRSGLSLVKVDEQSNEAAVARSRHLIRSQHADGAASCLLMRSVKPKLRILWDGAFEACWSVVIVLIRRAGRISRARYIDLTGHCMSPLRQHFRHPQLMRRALAVLLVLSLACAMLPLTLPGSQSKDLTEAFPCQHHACGCRSAAQCWKSCCCFTNAQKVEWARRENVKLPDFVIVAAAQEQSAKTKKSSCCSSHRRGASSSHIAVATAAKSDLSEPHTNSKQGTSNVSRVVIGWNALKCQGVESDITAGCIVAVLPLVDLPVFEVADERFEATSEKVLSLSVRPPEPPPRAL